MEDRNIYTIFIQLKQVKNVNNIGKEDDNGYSGDWSKSEKRAYLDVAGSAQMLDRRIQTRRLVNQLRPGPDNCYYERH
jgi:hypothetical protein